MKKILTTLFATTAALSFTTVVFAADIAKPVVPAGPVVATSIAGEAKSSSADVAADTKKAQAKAKAVQAGSLAEATVKADIKAATDAAPAAK